MIRRTLLLLAACSFPTLMPAQVIRGEVIERESGSPIAGVLVTLEPLPLAGDRVLSVLSDASGAFALRAAQAGRYRVIAKRIGVTRFVSPELALADGETRLLNIALDRLAQVLPEVRVADIDFCVTRPAERARVAALWDEARTALAAAQVSLRDRLFEGQIKRYSRGLDPRSLRVLEESWSGLQGVMDRPFASLSGDSLSRVGYRQTIDQYTWYHLPDAAVLTSGAFQRDHCYSEAAGGRSRRGMTGLAFEPESTRTVPEVRGTLWLDERTFELRLVEFRFTGLGSFPGSDRVGGEIHFQKLANGAWFTSRWFLRVPQDSRTSSAVDAETRLPSVVVRPTEPRLIEEGGLVVSARPRGADKR